MTKNENLPFADIVGQESAKKRISFYQDCYTKSSMIPNIMFVAPKGCGKTMMAKAMGKLLESPEEKEIIAKELLEL